jgi:hypothetical protein
MLQTVEYVIFLVVQHQSLKYHYEKHSHALIINVSISIRNGSVNIVGLQLELFQPQDFIIRAFLKFSFHVYCVVLDHSVLQVQRYTIQRENISILFPLPLSATYQTPSFTYLNKNSPIFFTDYLFPLFGLFIKTSRHRKVSYYYI